ncbi:protease [Azoarcus sp. CIB]|uniref:trypsin-like serine peptidase n=1 Tax=Aromatoleum sp. (strain CIB) TaxID=198107 RepID=UPI00067DA355|nr:serine protease [Azoarcus sp. CIB]AKU11636.1 protease [Azoarcus sp. CIB]
MKARYPESREERAQRAADFAKCLARASEASLESATQPALPSTDELASRMAARIGAAAPKMATDVVAGTAVALAQAGHDTALKLARAELHVDDLSDKEVSGLEAVISVTDRPAWFVEDNLPDTASFEASGLWIGLATAAESKLMAVCRAVGCIVLEVDGKRQPIGTGWLIGPRTLVTNAHVGVLLARLKPDAPADDSRRGYRLRSDVKGFVDFSFEHATKPPSEVAIEQVLYVEPSQVPDIAVFRIADDVSVLGGRPKIDIDLAERPVWEKANVFTVGHPVVDLQSDPNVATVFGPLDGTKRLSPGKVRQILGGNTLAHDCSTTNGSSGSPVIDFGSYLAVGLHYFGNPGERNEAVLFPAIKAHAVIVKNLAQEWGI